MKPKRLEVLRHGWNDGWNSGTYIAAHFDEPQSDPPPGWTMDDQYVGRGVCYTKRFPYGTDIVVDSDGRQHIV